jgi:hypothetical protein
MDENFKTEQVLDARCSQLTVLRQATKLIGMITIWRM